MFHRIACLHAGTEHFSAVRRSSKPEVPEGFRTITEGAATILLQGEDVFYNPAQARVALRPGTPQQAPE